MDEKRKIGIISIIIVSFISFLFYLMKEQKIEIIFFLFFFILSLGMIFKPIIIYSLYSRFLGWSVVKSHFFTKIVLIFYRIMGIFILIVMTNMFLDYLGVIQTGILGQLLSKIKLDKTIILIPIVLFVLCFLSIPLGLFGMINPSKLRSYTWTLSEKYFGVTPKKTIYTKASFLFGCAHF